MSPKKLTLQSLTGPQKCAILLLTLGEQYTSKIFKKLSDTEIKYIATAMADINEVPQDVLVAVAEEFITNFEDEDRLLIGGQQFIKSIIENSLDKEKAQLLFKDIEDAKREQPFTWSREVDIGALAGYVRGEHPQTIAMILAHLPSEISGEILMSLPEDRKGDIAMRIAQLGQVPDDVVRDVDETLRSEMKGMGSSGKRGGLDVLVEILNGSDKATEDIVMESIEEENADMAADIRQMMFVFEDLVNLDDRGMREILKKVESAQLTLALKTASQEMKDKILGNLSQRASEMLMEDLEVMGPVKLSEVEEAQQEVIAAAKELEADGTISLGKGKEDVLV